MTRPLRPSLGEICYHVMSRGNGRATVFHDESDYRLFLNMMDHAHHRLPMRVLAYCLMPNHVHLVLWPFKDKDLSRWMQWLLSAQARRLHKKYVTDGHIWQGRYKAFPIQDDRHILCVLRYVECNPLRAGLVSVAREWPWSSLKWWSKAGKPGYLDEGPVPRPFEWQRMADEPADEEDLRSMRICLNKGAPYGEKTWAVDMASRLGIASSLCPRGRPAASRQSKNPNN